MPTNVSYIWRDCAANPSSHGGDAQTHITHYSGEKLHGVEIDKCIGPGHNQLSCHCQGHRQSTEPWGRTENGV